MRSRLYSGLGVMMLVIALARGVCAGEITVFAAASLTDSLKDIAAGWPDKVNFNFGASSMLARQIEEGAPADLFFSADEAKMDALEKKGLIASGTRKSRLSNTLVIVVAKEQGTDIAGPKDLATDRVKRLALAEPSSVPAGIYAKDYLQKLKLWEAVKDKVVPTENVRAALAAVESGNVDAGIVYKTDAGISKKVKVAYEVPRKEGPEISYPMAVVKGTKNLDAAGKFLDYLGSEPAAKVFRKYGFLVQ